LLLIRCKQIPMKKEEIAGFIFAFIAYTLKIYRIHFHTYFIVAAIIYLLGLYIYMVTTRKIEMDSFFIGLSSTFLLIWLLFLTKFFPMGIIPMSFSFISLVVGVYFKFRNKSTLADGRQWINLVILILCIVIYKMPNDQQYYFTGIKYNYEIESDYMTWAKYSWFLYREGKYVQALSASERALSIANQMNDDFWIEKIIDQQEKIQSKNWTKY